MAENTKEGEKGQSAPNKRGGKLPILLALMALLAGGGYFGLRTVSGAKAESAEVKLGEIVPLNEFLVNLRGNGTYARAEIAVQLRSDYKKDAFSKNMEAVRDKIVLLLSSKSLAEVETLEGKLRLKGEIAEALNKLLLDSDPEAAKLAAKPADQPSKASEKEKGSEPSELRGRADWQSTTGPVLKVFLTSFATQ